MSRYVGPLEEEAAAAIGLEPDPGPEVLLQLRQHLERAGAVLARCAVRLAEQDAEVARLRRRIQMILSDPAGGYAGRSWTSQGYHPDPPHDAGGDA